MSTAFTTAIQKSHRLFFAFLAISVSGSLLPAQSSKLDRLNAPDKFIPTFTFKYGGPTGAPSLEETAKFDLLIVSSSKYYNRTWSDGKHNSWQSLKKINPDMVILTYKVAPSRYNTASWGEIGKGWEWMKKHHGIDSEDRWIAQGVQHKDYLQSPVYANERLALPGNPNWRKYWIETVYDDFWGGKKGIDADGIDGLFVDVATFKMITNWLRAGHSNQKDHPQKYYINGEYKQDRWRADMATFFKEAIPWMKKKNLIFVPNFGYMKSHPEYWKQLEEMPQPPFAAMEESGFINPYGKGSFNSWGWEETLQTMSRVKKTRMLMTAHASFESKATGLERMNVVGSSHTHGDEMNGWDGLWFAMTSFLLGFDDIKRNAYMNFTVWGFSKYHWLDEFDPKYLHLGRAKGNYIKQNGLFIREFEDGWVIVNSTRNDLKKIAAPQKDVRVIYHENFKTTQRVPLVSHFDLSAHRGIILLKKGRKIGNVDNLE